MHRAASVTISILSEQSPANSPQLRLLFWETTAACNLACVHCRRLDTASELGRDDLTTAQAKAMIDSLTELGRPIVVFSGGEPMMRPDLYELAEYARDRDLPTALATNGTLIDQTAASRIAQAGFRRVAISFDGPVAAMHDKFRGIEGSFDAAVRGLTLTRQAGVSTQINSTITRLNHHHLDEVYQLALDLQVDALHLFLLVPVGCGVELDPAVRMDAQEYEAALNWLYERSTDSKLQLKATCAPQYLRIVKQQAADERARQRASESGGHPATHPAGSMHTQTKGCLAGQAVCFVSARGEVFPCGYLPVEAGNVKQQRLPEIWAQSAVFDRLRDNDQLTGKCGCCEFNKVCMGCRARAFAETGDYMADEPNCDYTPVRLRTADLQAGDSTTSEASDA